MAPWGRGAVYFIPDGEVNPWVGYGIGYEAVGFGMVFASQGFATTLAGYEFAHVMGGADFRMNRVFGLGPFVDVSFGRYTDRDSADELDDGEQATHGWATFGIRVAFFP